MVCLFVMFSVVPFTLRVLCVGLLLLHWVCKRRTSELFVRDVDLAVFFVDAFVRRNQRCIFWSFVRVVLTGGSVIAILSSLKGEFVPKIHETSYPYLLSASNRSSAKPLP